MKHLAGPPARRLFRYVAQVHAMAAVPALEVTATT
jgi:hypothetical protein